MKRYFCRFFEALTMWVHYAISFSSVVGRCPYTDITSTEIPVFQFCALCLDFLVGMPHRIPGHFDVPGILQEMGFDEMWATYGGYCKYVHPELEVEFLIPEYGRGSDEAVNVEALGVSAQPLRYLGLAHKHSLIVAYEDLDIRVPKPAAFVLLKFLVVPRRKEEAKARRDAETALALGSLLLDMDDERIELVSMFESLPRGWKRTIEQVARKHAPLLMDALIQG